MMSLKITMRNQYQEILVKRFFEIYEPCSKVLFAIGILFGGMMFILVANYLIGIESKNIFCFTFFSWFYLRSINLISIALKKNKDQGLVFFLSYFGPLGMVLLSGLLNLIIPMNLISIIGMVDFIVYLIYLIIFSNLLKKREALKYFLIGLFTAAFISSST
jgi:hypothetical protein